MAIPAAARMQDQPGMAVDPRLDPTPLRIDDLGFSINLPRGADVETERIGEKRTYVIRDTSIVPRWSLRIATLDSSKPNVTALEQIQTHFESLKRSEQPYDVLALTPREVDGRAGHLAIVRRDVPSRPSYVEGWLIAPRGARSFLVISLLTLPEHLREVMPILETAFDTITLTGVLEQNASQEVRADRGRMFLAQLTETDLRTLIGVDRWVRIHQPTAQGDMEIGYSHIVVREDVRGALNPTADPNMYSLLERESGLMIEMQARIVDDRERDIYIDMVGRYWLAWNQESEAWSSLATVRQRDASQTASEIGTRTPAGTGPAKLVVVKAVSQINTREPYEWILPDGFLSQPLAFVLGELLPRDIAEPTVYQFYAYHPTGEDNVPRLALRTETWSPPTTTQKYWTLSTQIAGEMEQQQAFYSDNGEFIRRRHSDGTLTEIVEPEALRTLWERKKLRTGRTN